MIEEVVGYVLMIAIGAPGVVLALGRGDPFGRAATICLAMVLLGFAGLARRRGSVPAARALKAQRSARRR